MIRLRTQKLMSGVSALAALMTFGAAGSAQATAFHGPGAVDPIDTSNATQVPDTSSVLIDTNAHVGVDADGVSVLNPRTTPGLILLGGGATSALIIANSVLDGSIVNGGVISSTVNDGININTSSVLGGITNSESILSSGGVGSNAIDIVDSLFQGGINNQLHAGIVGGQTAIFIHGDTTFGGGITNAGSIDVLGTTGNTIRLDNGVAFTGGILNTANGGIWGHAGHDAISISADSFEGGISNAGLIVGQGAEGYAIDIQDGSFTGGITNAAAGIIRANGASGIAIDVFNDSFEGGIVNDGLIEATGLNGAALVVASGTFSGGISNAGSIESGNGNAVSITGLQFSGGLHNSGEILSDAAVALSVTGNNVSGGITNAEGGLIQGFSDAIRISSASFSGGISNAGVIVSTSSSNAIEITSASFTGGIVNSGSILALASSTPEAAISLSGASFAGGISNSGLIEGGSNQGAIDVLNATFSGGIQNSGSIIGDGANAIYFNGNTFLNGITNEAGGLINSTSNAIELTGATFSGGISNAGIIGGTTSGDADIAIHVGTSFQGGITNDEGATIQGSTNGIQVNGGSFLGGIHNAGVIRSTDTSANNLAITVAGGSFAGGIENTGTISAVQTVIGVSGGSFSGGISNAGSIVSTGDNGTAIAFTGGSFTGGISNTGTILGGDIAISLAGGSFADGITNDGRIQSKGIAGTAILVSSGSFSGGITNNVGGIIQAGTTSGTAAAIVLSGATFSGGIVNDGLIQGGTSSGVGINAGATTFLGGISNTGTIQGAATGIIIQGNTFSGGLTNEGGLIQTTGSGFGALINSTTFNGGVDNSGVIKGRPGLVNDGTGLQIMSSTFNGGINNSGTISGDDPGLFVDVGTFNDGIVNSGLIEGINADGATILATTFTGGIQNSGSITGDFQGLDVDVSNFDGDIENTLGGVIEGGDGVILRGGNYHGNVLNDGLINGGEGEGLRLEMDQLAGNVVNSGLITASNDALKIAGGTTVTGSVTNEGSILSGQDAIDVNGVVQGALSNSGLLMASDNGIDVDGRITGGIFNTGSIVGFLQGGIDLSNATASIDITQTDGLISDGGGEFSYAIDMDNANDETFFANGGVVQGDIYSGGETGDDMITERGTFVWEYGDTGETQFVNFDVDAGATSILGATERGDGFGQGVGVATTSAAFDGHVYLDDNTQILAGELTQASTGTIEYFVTTDDFLGGSDTHAVIDVASGLAGGLDGKVAVYVDPVTFADEAVSGVTKFEYHGVVQTTAAVTVGDLFANHTSIETSSLFFTGEAVANGNNIDLRLNRVAFADALNADGETENQNAVGGAIDELYDGGEFSSEFQDLIEALYGDGLTPEEVQAIYDELGGSEHAQLQNTTLGLSGLLGRLVGDRLDSTLPGLGGGKSASLAFRQYADGTDGKTATDATPPASYGNRGLNTGMSGASIWAKGFGDWTKADGDTEATGYDQNTGGAAVGLDFAVASNATLGLAGSWSTTDVSFDTAGDDATVDTWQGGVYGSVGIGRFYLDGSATYSAHDVSASRFVDLPGPATPFTASSNYNASAWSLNGEFGSIFRMGRIDLQPSAALSYTSLSTDGFTETDADNPLNPFALNVQGSDASSFASTLAVRGSGQFMMGRTRVMPDVKLGWRHDFGDDRQTFTAAFEEDTSVPFEIVSSKTSADAAIVNAGITAAVTKSLEVFVDLNGQYSGDVTTSNAAGGVRFTW